MKTLADIAHAARGRILKLSSSAKSAHAGSALSCVEILSTAFFLRQNQTVPVERIILSKGHAAMALYAVAEQFGFIASEELDRYLQDGTRLWGHPSTRAEFGFIDWSTGSLGHGLAAATGFAYSQKKLKKGSTLQLAVLSDGECNEGSVWEAALFAAHHRLNNLVAVVDYNKIQSFGTVAEIAELEPFADKWRSFGWEVSEVDGHDLSSLSRTLVDGAFKTERPRCILAHTIKGKGVRGIENTVSSHYKPITPEQVEEYLR